MSFEVFERPRPGRAQGTGMTVRVSREGRMLHLNAAAYREMGEPDRVRLLRDGDSIAFQASDKDDEAAFGAALGNISCTRFIEFVGLTPGSKLILRREGGLLRTDGK
jgi:hypothetical protein